jgi:hypothetical protein
MMIKKALTASLAGMLAAMAGSVQAASVVTCNTGTTTTPTDTQAIIDATKALCKTDPLACGISLSDLLGEVQFGETEPNDSMYTADPLTPNYPMSGQLRSASDQDWYHFETSQANAQVTLSFPTMPGNWIFNIHDFAGNTLASTSTISPNATTDGYAFKATLANPGRYYVSVVTPSFTTWIDDIYQFTLVLREFNDGNTQPNYNFYDVEMEQNQRNDLFSTATPLTTNHEMRGQLQTGNDIDIFRIDSNGNEILTVNFCQPGTICNDSRESWVVLAFDGSKVNDATLSLTASVSKLDESHHVETFDDPTDPDCTGACYCTLSPPPSPVPDDDTGGGTSDSGCDGVCTQISVSVPGVVTYTSDNPHFVWYHTGYEIDQTDIPGDDRNKLRGVLDPHYGAPTSLDIVADRAGTFYVMVVSKLALQEDLSMVYQEEIDDVPDALGVMIEDYNTRNYSLRLSRTQLDPNMSGNPLDPNMGYPSGAVGPLLQSLQAKLDTTAHTLTIPELLHEGRIYKAVLKGTPLKKGGYSKFVIQTMTAVATPLTVVSGVPSGTGGAEMQALQAELNTVTHELHIPELLYDGRIVEMILKGTRFQNKPGYKEFKPTAMNTVYNPITKP